MTSAIGAIFLWAAAFAALAGELQVVTEDFPPYTYSLNGKVVGRHTAVVRAVLERAGVPYSIKVLPWADAYRKATTEPDVLIYTLYRMPFRTGLFQWIGAVDKNRVSKLFRLKGPNLHPAASLNDAKALSIGCSNYDDADCQLLRTLGFKHIVTHEGLEEIALINGLKTKKLDYVADDEESVAKSLEDLKMPKDLMQPELILYSAAPYFALSNKTDPVLAQKLKKAYDELLQEGKIHPL